MKICLIAPLFDPWNIGGAEKYVNTLSQELAKHHEIVVITTAGPAPRKDEKSGSSLKIIEIEPNNIYSLYFACQNLDSIPLSKKLLWHLFSVWNLSSFIQIKKILHAEKPDIVHTNGIQGLSSSVFSVIKKMSIPHVHTIHDYELISPWVNLYRGGKPTIRFNLLDRIYMRYMRKISGNVDAVISPSKFILDFVTKLGFFKNSRNFVVPIGVQADSNIIPKQNATGEFLFIGRIAEDKGVQVAVNAFKKIKDGNVKLHVVGKGPYLNSVKLAAAGDERIIIHGFVQNDDLIQIFKKCSFFMVPSLWYENFPLVINEAMNKGLPVIASKIGGIPEIVKHGYNGFLFEPGNIDALYLIIKDLLYDKAILPKLSKNAIESSRGFTIEEQITKTLNIYSEVLFHKNN